MTITPGHVRAFQMLRSPFYDNITLADCTINGEPGVAIIVVDQISEEQIAVMPLFVAITAKMEIDFPQHRRGRRGGTGGGPQRPEEAFKQAQADVTSPAPA